MLTSLELPHVLAHTGAADTGVALGAHVVAEGHHNLLDLLCQLSRRGKDQGLKQNIIRKYL